jgi:hypothetical protein
MRERLGSRREKLSVGGSRFEDMDTAWVSELDGTGCADALADSHAAMVAAEVTQMRLVAHWCDLHSGDDIATDGERALPGRERMVTLGGDGTPRVREFPAAELGLLLGTTTTAAQWLMRDVLDLRHRHPRLYAAVEAGEVRFFQARQVARLTHQAALTREQARLVDDRMTPYLSQVPWGRMISLVEAAIIAADPEGAEQRRLAKEMERFVRTGRSSEYGTKTIYARARAGDAIFFMAMCDRIAQILALRGQTGTNGNEADGGAFRGPDVSMDVLRSEAIGILANPTQALALLHWAEQQAHETGEAPEDGGSPGVVDPSALPEAPSPAAVRPPATLYVHMSEESFLRQCRGAVRVEDVGPITVEQAVEFLHHCHVTVRPLLDLNDSPAVDSYESSPRVREVIELRQPVEVFPWGTLSSRKADKDHTREYVSPDNGGPPGQTTPDNMGPLGRSHHRLKTHGGWRLTQPQPGVFLWRSPHGYGARVDASGTHALGRVAAPQTVLERHFERLLAA